MLHKRINVFRASQAHFLPEALLQYDDTSNVPPEQLTLFLPSQIPKEVLRLPGSQKLANMEAQFRMAQAFEALAGVRRSLAVKAELARFKKVQVRGQHANTRASGLLNSAQQKVDAYAARYCRARLAYSTLVGTGGDWEKILKELNKTDIRSLDAHQDELVFDHRSGRREGHRKVSWIWMNPLAEGELHDGCSLPLLSRYYSLMTSS